MAYPHTAPISTMIPTVELSVNFYRGSTRADVSPKANPAPKTTRAASQAAERRSRQTDWEANLGRPGRPSRATAADGWRRCLGTFAGCVGPVGEPLDRRKQRHFPGLSKSRIIPNSSARVTTFN
jgi:hypothetical protein